MCTRAYFFIGIDGSGKSTHAQAIEDLLRSEGTRVKHVWMRRIAYCSLPLLAICRVLGITKVRRLRDGSHWISEYPFYAYRPIQLLWPLLQLIDSMLHTLFFVKLPLFLKPCSVVIIDRGIVDTLIDVMVDTQKSHLKLENLFVYCIPHGSFIGVFDVDEEIAMSRKNDVPSIEYLKIRRKLYLKLAMRHHWSVISTSGDFNVVHKKVLTKIQVTN